MSKANLKTKSFEIDWAAVDAAPLANAPDDDSPELTANDKREFAAIGEILPGLNLGKQRITIMLDATVVQAYKAKAGGRGYQTLINENPTPSLGG